MSTRATGADETMAEGRDVGEQERALDSAILCVMLRDRDGYPWSREELVREFGGRIDTLDAVRRLEGAGLVHRLDEFVFPTLACRRADELDFG